MAYTSQQVNVILLKTDRTMYKIGQIAYENMFAEDNEALDYERDIIFIYKNAVEYADDYFIDTERFGNVLARLASKIFAYDYGELNPIYADSALVNVSTIFAGAVLNDLNDVTITNLLDNQLLRYNQSVGQWVNVGPSYAVRGQQSFIAMAGQTTFITAMPFDSNLLDIYLNGVRINNTSYSTMGEYQITFLDALSSGDVVDITMFDPETTIVGAQGTVTSVGLTMPPAFNVAGSPIESLGVLAVTAAGTAAQYVRGDGTLATYTGGSTGGRGASVNYYLNGSVNQGTFGGSTYYEINRTPILGTGTDFSRNTNGLIAQFITDAGDPALLNIPAGNWTMELYFSASSGGGNPSFYVELYKYDGTTFTLIASDSANPEGITNGTAIDQYITSLAVPDTNLTLTDRLAIRVFVTTSGRTIRMHTEGIHLSEILTTFTTGLTALNGLTEQVQYFGTSTTGTDFAIVSAGQTHSFNIPTASSVNRGLLSPANWSSFNGKQENITVTTNGTRGEATFVGNVLNIPNYGSPAVNLFNYYNFM